MIENDVIFENENLKILFHVNLEFFELKSKFSTDIIYQLGDKIITYDAHDRNGWINFLIYLLKTDKIDNEIFRRIYKIINNI